MPVAAFFSLGSCLKMIDSIHYGEKVVGERDHGGDAAVGVSPTAT
jgi:hypothetical protein